MKCTISGIWGRRPEYPDYPELIEAWTEYEIENYPEGFAEEVDKAKALDHYDEVRVINVVVDFDAVQAAFAAPKIEGSVRKTPKL